MCLAPLEILSLNHVMLIHFGVQSSYFPCFADWSFERKKKYSIVGAALASQVYWLRRPHALIRALCFVLVILGTWALSEGLLEYTLTALHDVLITVVSVCGGSSGPGPYEALCFWFNLLMIVMVIGIVVQIYE